MPQSGGLATPILLLIFNRPDTTRAVMNSIRAVSPTTLYVAADGPRPGREGEASKCAEARRLATSIDWDCRTETLFRKENLGAGPAVAAAISWFFDHESQGIILEDDCVPGPSFYRFCTELLSYYQGNPAIMHISGNNFQYGRRRGSASYYFSRYTHSWGWATWKRAWEKYDFTLIPETDRGHVWDVQWLLSVEKAGGMAVLPNVNLVTNVGFGKDATHTRTRERYAMLPAGEMSFPLIHPTKIAIDRAADTLTYYANFRNIPDLRWIPIFHAWDYVSFRVRKLFRIMRDLLRPMRGANP